MLKIIQCEIKYKQVMNFLKTTNLIPVLAIFTLIFAFGQKAEAQILEPVKWSYESVAQDDGTYQLVFTATMEKGWYVYSQDIEDGGPIPTTFEFDESKDFELVGEIVERGELIEKFDNMFDMNIKKYPNEVVFVATVKPINLKAEISGYLTFMTCDDMRCLPPDDVDFEFTLE